jgi:hypothetical protein
MTLAGLNLRIIGAIPVKENGEGRTEKEPLFYCKWSALDVLTASRAFGPTMPVRWPDRTAAVEQTHISDRSRDGKEETSLHKAFWS